MALAERAQALAGTGFATMVRNDPAKQTKRARPDEFRDDDDADDKAVCKSRSVDLLPPVIWAAS